jgi:hypothetical protein
MNVLAQTEAPVPSPSSSYVEQFAQIAALQAKGDYYGIIQTAERADLAVRLPSSLAYEHPLNFNPSVASRSYPIITPHGYSSLCPSCSLVL